jgi:DNA-binding Lrp family transcriptional regulator
MDPLDRKLLRILERDTRITYRELSEKLGISIPSVQKRIVSLEETGRVLGYTAHISLQALGGCMVVIQGSSTTDFAPDLVDELGKHSSIMTVMCGNQNNLVIGAFLRSISDLDPLVSFIQDVGRIPEPDVLLVSQASDISCTRMSGSKDGPQLSDLTNLDLRIIWALHKDARRSVSDVAAELGVSSKTVSRRLSRMMDNGLIDFHAQAVPNLDEDLQIIIQVRIAPGTDRQKVIGQVRRLPGDFIDEDLTFSNVPDRIMFVLFTQTLSELKNLLFQVKEIEGVVRVTYDTFLYQKYFDTWRDDLLAERIKQIGLKGALNSAPDAS